MELSNNVQCIKTMPSQGKCSNIYINPMFNDTVKHVIHINPKAQINVAIHVNPKMMNALSTCGLRQLQQPQLGASAQCLSDNLKPKIQKSVYVNPKLMKKLTTKVPDVVSVKPPVTSAPTTPRLKKNNGHVNTNTVVQKSSSNFVSLSKSKLIRVRPTTNSEVVNFPNSNQKIIAPLRPVALNRSKKFNSVDRRVIPVNKSKCCVRSAPTNSRFKIDRTGVQKKKIVKPKLTPRKVSGSANKHLIKIDGVLYKSSKSQLVKSKNNNASPISSSMKKSSGSALNSSRKIIKRRSAIVKTIINRYSSSNISQKLNYKNLLRNRVKQKSIQILRHKMTKNNQPCLFFQRFGYCVKHTAGTCPKVHDKKQVVLCKSFLQGNCLLDNCLLSHEVGPEKMPTCKYFLDGCCSRDACPYLHVKVSANTPICIPFIRGYCAKGNECKQRHINICPQFEKTGKCAKGKNCPYPHKTVLAQRSSSLNTKKTTFNKRKTVNKTRSVNPLPPQDESIKRYYDDNNSSETLLLTKKMRIIEKIKIMKNAHSSVEENSLSILSDSTVDNNNAHQQSEEHSQPCHQNLQYKRPPIGPLPSYIPFE